MRFPVFLLCSVRTLPHRQIRARPMSQACSSQTIPKGHSGGSTHLLYVSPSSIQLEKSVHGTCQTGPLYRDPTFSHCVTDTWCVRYFPCSHSNSAFWLLSSISTGERSGLPASESVCLRSLPHILSTSSCSFRRTEGDTVT